MTAYKKDTYTVKIKYLTGEEYTTTFLTDSITWTMEQYQRNRSPFDYEILLNK